VEEDWFEGTLPSGLDERLSRLPLLGCFLRFIACLGGESDPRVRVLIRGEFGNPGRASRFLAGGEAGGVIFLSVAGGDAGGVILRIFNAGEPGGVRA